MRPKPGTCVLEPKHKCPKKSKSCKHSPCRERHRPSSPIRKSVTAPVRNPGLLSHRTLPIHTSGVITQADLRNVGATVARDIAAVPVQSYRPSKHTPQTPPAPQRNVRFDLPEEKPVSREGAHRRVSASLRLNDSTSARFTLEAVRNPMAQGNWRWVARGIYTSGSRKGEVCVAKWLKETLVRDKKHFEADVRASNQALEIIEKFNKSKTIDKSIRLNMPEVWMFKDHGSVFSGTIVLCEPFVKYFQKFNSNTGWRDKTSPWSDAMQALSHYSFHITNGEYLLCDLQGGIYRDYAVLTDPVVLSRTLKFGLTDLGPEAISTFFHMHKCNSYCRPNWAKPADTKECYEPVPKTVTERRPRSGHK